MEDSLVEEYLEIISATPDVNCLSVGPASPMRRFNIDDHEEFDHSEVADGLEELSPKHNDNLMQSAGYRVKRLSNYFMTQTIR